MNSLIVFALFIYEWCGEVTLKKKTLDYQTQASYFILLMCQIFGIPHEVLIILFF